MRKLAIVYLVLFLYSISAVGNENRIARESRAKSLGGTFMTVYDSPTSALWNPAALDLLKRPVFEINIGQLYEFDIVSLSNYFPGFGTIGLSLRKWETNPATDLFMIGWGRFISSRLAIGVSTGLFQSESNFEPRLNVGLFYRFSESQPAWKMLSFENFSVGFFLRNLRLREKNLTDEQPRLSASVLYRSPVDWLRIYGSCEIGKSIPIWHGGLELKITKFVSFRVGNTDLKSRIWFWGLGVGVSDWQLNLVFDRTSEKLQFSTTIPFGMPLEEKAQKYYQQGIEDLKQRKLKEALRNFALAHELVPRDATYTNAFYLLKKKLAARELELQKVLEQASALEKQGYFFSAALKYSQLLEQYPEHAAKIRSRLVMLRPKVKYDIRRILNKGEEFFNAGDYLLARKIFQKILLLDSQNNEAKEYLQRSEQLVQKQIEEHFYRGVGYYKQRNLVQAEQEFATVLQLDSTHKEAQHYLEQTRAQKDELENQIADLLKKAEKLEKQHAFLAALRHYIKVLRLDYENQQAKDAVVRLRPKVRPDIQSFLVRAKQALAQENYAAAQKYYEQVLQIVPDQMEARAGLSKVQKERREKSRQLLTQGKKMAAAGKWEQAVLKFKQALNYDPTSATVRSELDSALRQINIQALLRQGLAERDKGNYVRAIKLFNKVLDQDPLNTEATEYLEKTQREKSRKISNLLQEGIKYYSADNFVRAIACFDKLLEVDPENQVAQEYLKRAQQKQRALEKLQ